MNELTADTIKELQIWLHGEFELVRQSQQTDRDELRKVRETVHNLSNQVSPLIMADIPNRISKQGVEIAELREERIARKSAINTVKFIYTGLGAAGGVLTTLILWFGKVIH